MIDAAIAELAPIVGGRVACRAVGEPMARHYRRHRQSPLPPAPKLCREPNPGAVRGGAQGGARRAPRRRPSGRGPGDVYAKLLDEGTYLPRSRQVPGAASRAEVRERRRRPPIPQQKSPSSSATRPEQVWSWDITKLLGPEKWNYFYLYVVLDIFSRYVVGWMLAPRRTGRLAKALLAEAIRQQGSARPAHHPRRSGHPHGLQAGRLLVADLGVTKTHTGPT